VSYCWVRRGERKRVPYEPPQGRRYNTMALYVPTGPHAAFDWCGTTQRHFDAADLLHFLRQRPAAAVPLVLVLDNASFHRNTDVRRALPELRAHNVFLYYLPPYAPELNAIEPVFRAVKHLDLAERRYTSAAALEAAVDAAFARAEAKVLGQPKDQLRLAA
jgi:putative transposase